MDTVKEFFVGRLRVEIDIDEDCENPLESYDGMGSIHSCCTRHSNFIPSEEKLHEYLRNPHTVKLSYYEHGGCLWDVQGGKRISMCPDPQWDQVRFAGVWVPDKEAENTIRRLALESLLPGVTVQYETKLNEDGTLFDQKHLNVIMVTLPDGRKFGGYKTCENAYRAAAKRLGIPLDPQAVKDARRAEAVKLAATACEEYTAWVNGECYEYAVRDPDNSDEVVSQCGGYVGDLDAVEKEAREAAESELRRMGGTWLTPGMTLST